jgi:hypothetical protein
MSTPIELSEAISKKFDQLGGGDPDPIAQRNMFQQLAQDFASLSVSLGALAGKSTVEPGLDFTRILTAVGVANNAVTTFSTTGSSGLAGYTLFLLSDLGATGDSVLVLLTNSVLYIVYQNAASYTLVPGTAGKTNLSYLVGIVTIENKTGSVTNYNVTRFPNR